MHRVSALLPLWERAKPAAVADGSVDQAANNNDSNSNSSSSSNSSSAASNLNRNSNHSSISSSTSAVLPAKANRPGKVFSWADRIGVGRTLTVSPALANSAAVVPPPATAPARMGREAYWPTTLDRECEKAARILKSFCTDGFLDDPSESMPTSPTSRASITSFASARFPPRRSNDLPLSSPTTPAAAGKKKIPPRIIQEAVGLAIFSCMRSGLWMSGSGGSGILIARKADGTWSPPSGIMLHTATLAFVIGVDIYDCVLVINSVSALEMFTRSRVTLGADVPLTVGPLTSVGLLENDFRWNPELATTVLTYLKARGRHRPAELHGSLVTERSNENERFYSPAGSSGGSLPIDILDILAGNIEKSVPEILPLFEAIKAAEGRIDFDSQVMERLSLQPAPGDADLSDTTALLSPTSPKSASFGVPDAADPDPFGIIALEMAGLEIREAGSKHRPISTQFDYANTSPTSPVFASQSNRQSADATYDRGSRASYMSTRTQATSMTDACTQTDVAGTPDTSLSLSHYNDGKEALDVAAPQDCSSSPPLPELALPPSPTADKTVTLATALGASLLAPSPLSKSTSTDVSTADYYVADDDRDADADDEEEEEEEETDTFADEGADTVVSSDNEDDIDDDIDDEEEPVVFEVATTAARPVRAVPTQGAQIIQAKGSLVTIGKRVPPPLPMRSPARRSLASKSDYDMSGLSSPVRYSFQSTHSQLSEVTTAISQAEATEQDAVKQDAVAVPPIAISLEVPSQEADADLANTPTASSAVVAPWGAEDNAAFSIPLPASPVPETESSASQDVASKSSPSMSSMMEQAEHSERDQTADSAASSMDESEREPQTPRPDEGEQPKFPEVTSDDHHKERQFHAVSTQEDVNHNMDTPTTITVV